MKSYVYITNTHFVNLHKIHINIKLKFMQYY